MGAFTVSVRNSAVVGGLLALSLSNAAMAQDVCEGCNRIIEVNQTQWDCLVSRLDSLAKESTPVVFFTLNEDSCPASRTTVIPPGRAVVRAREFYRLDKSQLECLIRIRKNVRGPSYKVDFTKMCGR